MKRYAVIVNGLIQSFIDHEDNVVPQFDPRVGILEQVDGLNPTPEQGWAWDGSDFFELAPPDEWNPVRAIRDGLLSQSDWTQLDDAPLDAGTKSAWAVYRQALRDVPQDNTDPEDVAWPTPPGA